MNGLDSESDPRLYQNLEYLETLTNEWGKLFRKSADTLVSISANTPANNTPNASVNAGITENVDETSVADYSISLPFAAHELFIKLTAMMKYVDLVPLLLRILYGILPFLKLHLESIINKMTRETDIPPHPYIENIVLFYFCHVSDALSSFETPDSRDTYTIQIREESLYFALKTFQCLSSLQDVSRLTLVMHLISILGIKGSNGRRRGIANRHAFSPFATWIHGFMGTKKSGC